MTTVKIKAIKIPSKKNQYAVRFSKVFLHATSSIRAGLRRHKQRICWIGPSDDVKAAEEQIGWMMRSSFRTQLKGPLRLTVAVSGKGARKDIEVTLDPLEEGEISPRAGDLDGVLTTVMDGLQKWPVENDAQICDVRIYRKSATRGTEE